MIRASLILLAVVSLDAIVISSVAPPSHAPLAVGRDLRGMRSLAKRLEMLGVCTDINGRGDGVYRLELVPCGS